MTRRKRAVNRSTAIMAFVDFVFVFSVIDGINQFINYIDRLIKGMTQLINGITRITDDWGARLGSWGGPFIRRVMALSFRVLRELVD